MLSPRHDKAFEEVWNHTLGVMKEAYKISGGIDIEMGEGPPRNIHIEFEPDHCHFEELERGRPD